ncbi:MAG: hypothetical protein ACJ8EZ_02835 [Sphingomicrobium sp.]
MKSALLGFAGAIAASGPLATPAAAQDQMAFSPGGMPSGPLVRLGGNWAASGDRDRHHRRHHGDRRDRVDVIGGWGWSDGDWAYYNNRTWDSDSYNDWWHDRPDRSFPRWMQHNQNCERMWWSGGGWRC